MKTNRIAYLVKGVSLLSVFLLMGCSNCEFLFFNCNNCDDIDRGIQLADLVLENFESDQDEEGGVVDIIHTVINTARDFACPDEVAEAGMHSDNLILLFSENEDFTNPEAVDQQTMNVTELVGPNETYRVVSEVTFEQDGFYMIGNSIDVLDEVSERDEENNGSVNSPTRMVESIAKLHPERIIHITSNGNEGRPSVNSDGTKRYIGKWKIYIEYQ